MAAYSALCIVIREHAGYLQSYTADYRARLLRCVEILDECADDEELITDNGDIVMVWVLRRVASERIRRFAPELMPVDWDMDPYRWYPISRHIRALYDQQVHEMMAPIRQAILDQPVVFFEF
jgi:hypothetical protein